MRVQEEDCGAGRTGGRQVQSGKLFPRLETGPGGRQHGTFQYWPRTRGKFYNNMNTGLIGMYVTLCLYELMNKIKIC